MKNTVLVILMALVLAFSACAAKTTTTDKEIESDIKVEENLDAEEETHEDEQISEETSAEDKNDVKEEKPETSKEEEKPSEPVKEEEKPAKPQQDSRSLSEIMTSLTSNLGEMPMIGEIPLDEENFAFYTFADYVKGAEGLVSEPMMGSFAHSVVLVRLPEGTDVSAFASKVKNNADPRKWICVEAETVEVRTKGNLVLLVMSSKETANKIVSRF